MPALASGHGVPSSAPRADANRDLVRGAAAFCAASGMMPAVLVFHFDAGTAVLEHALSLAGIAGVVAAEHEAAPRGRASQVGRYLAADYGWLLPRVAARSVVVLDARSCITFPMARAAFRARIPWLVYASIDGWHRERTLHFIARKLAEKTTAFLGRLTGKFRTRLREASHEVRRRISPAARVFPRMESPDRRPGGLPRMERAGRLRKAFRIWRNPCEDYLDAAVGARLSPETFRPNRILLVNGSLSWGGAERQVVNTLLGLQQRGYADIGVLCEHLHDRPAHDFYLWLLAQRGIQARQIDRCPKAAVALRSNADLSRLTQVIHGLPINLRDDVFLFAHELMRVRPQVVHAWQDQTSIKVGLAAALVGVPRIVLASRNLPPYHFHYHLSYLAPAYRALARIGSVVFTNNSRRGALAYEHWLGLPRGTFRVVFNGIDAGHIARTPPAQAAAYKARLGIPAPAPVVGGIFRFYPEKDPLLWVRTARRILDTDPDTYFLLVGAGILKTRVEALAASLGLQERLILPGTEKQAALPLSIMDVFLLSSKREGTPNVVIEAQMLGVPVVATDAGGTADALVEGETGFIVRSRRARDLAAKVGWCLRNHAWRRAVAARAPEFATERFGFETMIDDTLETYGLPPGAVEPAGTDAAPSSRVQCPENPRREASSNRHDIRGR